MTTKEYGEEFKTALLDYAAIHGDMKTPAAKLAVQQANAREVINVAARRMVGAVAADIASLSATLNGKAIALDKLVEAKRNEAERAQSTAIGTVRGLFGDAVASNLTGRRSMKAMELDAEADRMVGQADVLRTDATSYAAGLSLGSLNAKFTITTAVLSEMTAEQMAGSVDNLMAAALSGRIILEVRS